MHEMALCESIVQILEEEARRHGFSRVRAVHLEVGALAGVEIPALEFGFEVVCHGTLAEGARLHVIRTPGTAWCLRCETTVEVPDRFSPCPRCGGWQVQVTGGEDLRIRELEVE